MDVRLLRTCAEALTKQLELIMTKFLSVACTLLLITIAPATAVGDRQFNYQSAGTIDRVDLESGDIIIGDMLYRLSPNLLIHGKHKRAAARKDLRKGMKIGMNTYRGASYGGSDIYIHEIRILPDNFDLDRILNEDDR
jgi:hypothetical protein